MTATIPGLATEQRFAADFAACIAVFEDELEFVKNALRRQGVPDPDTEDLAQEVFLVMWRRWSQYDPSRPIRPWLGGIAFRVAYNHRQRSRREVPGGFVDREDDAPDAEQRLASDKSRSMVRDVLAALPEKQRSLIVLHDVEGISVRAIAEEMAVPIPTAHTRLRAARKAFARGWKRLLAVTTTKAQLAPWLLAGAQHRSEPTPLSADTAPSSRATGAPADPPQGPTGSGRRKSRALNRSRSLLPWVPAAGFPRASSPLARPGEAPSGPHGTAPVRPRATSSSGRPWSASLSRPLWLALGVTATLVVTSPALRALLFTAPPPASTSHAPGPVRARVTPSGRIARPAFLPAASPLAMGDGQRPHGPGPGETLTEGLIGYWRFDDGVGSTWARDASGNGTDCRLRNLDPAVAWGDGHLGGGLQLAGQGWLECARADAIARLGVQITVALWVRRAPTRQKVAALVSRQHGDGILDAFHLGFRDDTLALRSPVKGGPASAPYPRTPAPGAGATGAPPLGAWHHVAATLDADGMARLYIDGELARKKQKDGRPSLGGGDNPLIIGGGINGSDEGDVRERFSGAVDELSIYDRALAPQEIQALARGQQPALSP